MHKIKINDKSLRTDLILEQNLIDKSDIKEQLEDNILVKSNKYKDNNYITIYYEDITDKDEYKKVEKVLLKELKKLIKIKDNDLILIIGLGNDKSTPDSLGPKTLNHVIVTRYLMEYSELESNYKNVAIYKPDVYGNTGVESIDIIKSIVKTIKPTKLIVIDSLKANDLNRLNKTIQITDSGIHPGSGIFNNRGEISKKIVNCDVYAIGIPTVVDIYTIIKEYKSDVNVKENFIVTPTNIDFVIDRLSYLLGNTLNNLIHNTTLSTNKE